MKFISQKPIKLIKNLFAVPSIMILCLPALADLSGIKALKTGSLELPDHKQAKLYFAITDEEQLRGLSGVQNNEFADNEALLFLYQQDGLRRFWMPDTYFNLDIFFLEKNGRVKKIARNVFAHPGTNETLIPIARTDSIFCRNVLEMKATSLLSQSIKEGDILKWTLPSSSHQKVQDIHQKQ